MKICEVYLQYLAQFCISKFVILSTVTPMMLETVFKILCHHWNPIFPTLDGLKWIIRNISYQTYFSSFDNSWHRRTYRVLKFGNKKLHKNYQGIINNLRKKVTNQFPIRIQDFILSMTVLSSTFPIQCFLDRRDFINTTEVMVLWSLATITQANGTN